MTNKPKKHKRGPWKMDCGCTFQGGPAADDYWWEECPLHKAAPFLLQACEVALPFLDGMGFKPGGQGVIDKMTAAINAATGPQKKKEDND